jgi:putative transposase
MPLIKEWQARPLQSVYSVVFLDAIHFKVKQDGHIVNKAAYMIIGIDLDGKKDVLGIWIGENESAKFWLSVLNELKNRSVQDILITCVDNLAGFLKLLPLVIHKLKFKSVSSTKFVIPLVMYRTRI